jgi:hypothetical protein
MTPDGIHDEQSSSSFSVKSARKSEVNGGKTKMRRRHSVDFKSGHEVLEIDKPEEDMKEEIWYSRDEYDIIKARNSLIVKMMKTGSFIESEEHSFRGLEHKLRDGFKQRRSNKFAALNAVLEEQDRQFNRNLSNPEVIAEAYRSISSNAKETAFAIGQSDTEKSLSYEATNGDITGATINVDPSENDADEEDLTDIDTVCSEESSAKRNRLRRLFSSVSRKREERMSKGKQSRRGSM